MILLQLNDLNKYFGAELILSNIKLDVQTGDKIAIVGRNGAGKSTLLQIIAGELSYDEGQIFKPKNLTIGYLEQNADLQSDKTIWTELLSVFEPLLEMEDRLRSLEKKMASFSQQTNQDKYDDILSEYDSLQTTFKLQGGYSYEVSIRAIINGLNFGTYAEDTKISKLSGGQKTRLALGKLLLMKPDLLILDEPTNHLDIETLSWLEQYLQSYEGAIIIVSHDRYFLDKLVNIVYEIENKGIGKYHGNYSKFLDKKAEEYEGQLKLYEKQQSEIANMEDFIRRNIARASTSKRAQSRRKQLERMDVIDRPLGDSKSANFSFEISKTSGNDVLKVTDLAIGYENNPIAKNINFSMNRGDSLALIGPNGIGKSTLLKTIANKLSSLSGNVMTGTNISIGYYDQELAELTSNKQIIDELWDDFPHYDEKEIRTVLGNFLFSGDDVLKPVSILSGGEKARVALAKLYMQKANFLILDEPTNHLDLDSKEVLENALIDYPGTILFVSHDRYFINRIASNIVELKEDETTIYLGDYDYYLDKLAELAELESLKTGTAEPVNSSNDLGRENFEKEREAKREERRRKRRIEELEKEISNLEEIISSNEKLLCNPDVFNDHEEVLKISKDNKEAETKLDILLNEWSDLLEYGFNLT